MEISPERLAQLTARCTSSDELAVLETLIRAADASGFVQGVSLHAIADRSSVDRLAVLRVLMNLQERNLIVRKKPQEPDKPAAWTVMLPRQSKAVAR